MRGLSGAIPAERAGINTYCRQAESLGIKYSETDILSIVSVIFKCVGTPYKCCLFPGSPSVYCIFKQRIPRPFKCAIKISGAVIDTINFHARSPNYHKEPTVQNTLFLSTRTRVGCNKGGEGDMKIQKRKGGMKIKKRKKGSMMTIKGEVGT